MKVVNMIMSSSLLVIFVDIAAGRDQQVSLGQCPQGQRVSPLIKVGHSREERYLKRCSRLDDQPQWKRVDELTASHVWSTEKVEAIKTALKTKVNHAAVPKVYVYPFPAIFANATFWSADANRSHHASSYFEAAFAGFNHANLIQESFHEVRTKTRIELRWTPSTTFSLFAMENQHLMGIEIHRAILQSPFLVDDPAQADLFFIPHYHLHLNKGASLEFCSRVMPLWIQMLEESAFFHRRQGKDHFVVSGRGLHRIMPENAVKDWSQNFYRSYDHTRGNADCQHFALVPKLRHISILMPEAQCPFARAHARVYPVPYASNALSSFMHTTRKSAGPEHKNAAYSFSSLFHPRRKRIYTLSIAIKAGAIASSSHSRERVPFRSILQKQCSKWQKCHDVPFVSLDLNPDRLADARDTYANSTFCLQPPGFSAARKGIVDALILGCIPVLFRNDSMLGTTSPMTLSPDNKKRRLLFDPLDQTDLWPWHWPWQNAASITLNTSEVETRGLNALIKEIPTTQVALARRVIQAYVPQLIWNIERYKKGARRIISEYLNEYARPTALDTVLHQLKGLAQVDCCTEKLISHAPRVSSISASRHKLSHSVSSPTKEKYKHTK